MAEAERRNKERDLANQSRDLQRMQREAREDLNLRRNEELASLQERANKVIQQIAERREVRPDPAGPGRLREPAHRHHRQGHQGARRQVAAPARSPALPRHGAGASNDPAHGCSRITLSELATRVGATLDGDGGVVVARVGTLENAGPDAIAFLSGPRYRAQLAGTRAGAVIVAPARRGAQRRGRSSCTPIPTRRTRRSRRSSIRRAAGRRRRRPDGARRRDRDASTPPRRSGRSRSSAPARASARARSIGAGACVGDDALIGDDTHLHPHVTIYARLRRRRRARSSTRARSSAPTASAWRRTPAAGSRSRRSGACVIGADCEIGANTTIDRGAIDDTVIEDDVKLDNQIQVGHNCRIGAHTAIAGCTGIAGSARHRPQRADRRRRE